MKHSVVQSDRTKALQALRGENPDMQATSKHEDPSLPRSIPKVDTSGFHKAGVTGSTDDSRTPRLDCYEIVTSSKNYHNRKLHGRNTSGMIANNVQGLVHHQVCTSSACSGQPLTLNNLDEPIGNSSAERSLYSASQDFQHGSRSRETCPLKVNCIDKGVLPSSIIHEPLHKSTDSKHTGRPLEQEPEPSVMPSTGTHASLSRQNSSPAYAQKPIPLDVKTCTITKQLAEISFEHSQRKEEAHQTEVHCASETEEPPIDKAQPNECGNRRASQPRCVANGNHNSQTGSTQHRLSQNVSNFKRARSSHPNNDGGDDESDDGLSRSVTDTDGRTLACPYFVHSPEKNRQCSLCILRSAAAVRQHLDRVHWDENLCDILQHLRQTDRLAPKEEKWRIIYRKLFPYSPPPASPYADDAVHAETLGKVANLLKALGSKVVSQVKELASGHLSPDQPLSDVDIKFASQLVKHIDTMDLSKQDVARSSPSKILSPKAATTSRSQNTNMKMSTDNLTAGLPSQGQFCSTVANTCQPGQCMQMCATNICPDSYPIVSSAKRLQRPIELPARMQVPNRNSSFGYLPGLGNGNVSHNRSSYSMQHTNHSSMNISMGPDLQSVSYIPTSVPISQGLVLQHNVNHNLQDSAVTCDDSWTPDSQCQTDYHLGATYLPAPPLTPPYEQQSDLCFKTPFPTSSLMQIQAPAPDRSGESLFSPVQQNQGPTFVQPSENQYLQQYPPDNDVLSLQANGHHGV